MSVTINAPVQAQLHLTSFWARYFSEIPACTRTGCKQVAIEVDPYFPYLDDFNRCALHRKEADTIAESGSVS